MRKFTAIILVFSLIFCLCACGHKEENTERDCGVFVTVQADDIYAVSCGRDDGSDSATPAEGGAIPKDTVYHFDFAGAAAEGSESAVISYMICIYDKDFNVISEATFEDDFANMAKVSIVVTKDHGIMYEGGKVDCGGKLVASMNQFNDSLGVYVTEAEVSIANNDKAADKISETLGGYTDSFLSETEANRASYTENVSGQSGEIPDFSMKHDVSVAYAGDNIVCFRTRDYVYLGTEEKEVIAAHNFDINSGSELMLEDVFNDIDALKTHCTEYILIATTEKSDNGTFKEGFTSVIPELVKDGNWYFSKDGLVIIANKGELSDALHEFTVPYSDIEKYINDDFITETDKDFTPGAISASFADDSSADSYTLLSGDDYASGDLLIAAEGCINDIGIYSVKYNSEKNSYGLVRQLFFCSDMREGGAIAVNAELQNEPNVLVQFTTPYGTVVNNLLSLDGDGNISVTDPDGGNSGIDIMPELPFTLDLNGDGNDDEISISGGKVTIESGANGGAFETGLEEISVALLHDADCDGNFELFVGGDMASDDYILYCLKFDGASITDITFDGEDYIYGDISTFKANTVSVNTPANILGTYSYSKDYKYTDGEFKSVDSEAYKIKSETFIVPTVNLTLDDGSTISAGTELKVTGTDFKNFVSVKTKDGAGGKLELTSNSGDGGWLINGIPENEAFQELPYAG